MGYITSVSMQVLWHGQPRSSFHPSGEIEQGDPLSPYIFALCMERLSHLVESKVFFETMDSF